VRLTVENRPTITTRARLRHEYNLVAKGSRGCGVLILISRANHHDKFLNASAAGFLENKLKCRFRFPLLVDQHLQWQAALIRIGGCYERFADFHRSSSMPFNRQESADLFKKHPALPAPVGA
jgi:hypothetical protein